MAKTICYTWPNFDLYLTYLSVFLVVDPPTPQRSISTAPPHQFQFPNAMINIPSAQLWKGLYCLIQGAFLSPLLQYFKQKATTNSPDLNIQIVLSNIIFKDLHQTRLIAAGLQALNYHLTSNSHASSTPKLIPRLQLCCIWAFLLHFTFTVGQPVNLLSLKYDLFQQEDFLRMGLPSTHPANTMFNFIKPHNPNTKM